MGAIFQTDPSPVGRVLENEFFFPFFHLKWCILLNYEQHFSSVPSPKNVEFSGDSVDAEELRGL